MTQQTKRNRMMMFTILAVILLSAAIFYAAIFIIERPGSIADRRLSEAVGMTEGILEIPIGKTPEEAVEQFRGGSSSPYVIHQEPVDKGVLLFKTSTRQGSENLQVEYVRNTRIGWKWVWGGGFSNHEASDEPSAVHYMSLPELKGVSTPFPMLFGYVFDPSIVRITVETMKDGSNEAKQIEVGPDERLWFVFLPSSADMPYEIKGYDESGEQIASKMIDDPNDSGIFDLGTTASSAP
ncbi:hypothetical protein ACFSVM_08940 [Paenibacillus shunpengii]|uniref:Uncharacterized protein n=1 Tax=Paenibacillus shunpengii TaxID=2054424 RepID=A0ABW5SLH0_9BACL